VSRVTESAIALPRYLTLDDSAGTHGNIQYSKALEFYEKDLEISLQVLPENHSDLATTFSNLASLYYQQQVSDIYKPKGSFINL
jgi:hypothetical protein